MLDDAIYYSRREAEERSAAKGASDQRARQIHAMLADRYGQLAQRALAGLPDSELAPKTSRLVTSAATKSQPSQRRFR